MHRPAPRRGVPWRTYVSGLLGVVLTTAVILYPEDAFEASVSGYCEHLRSMARLNNEGVPPGPEPLRRA